MNALVMYDTNFGNTEAIAKIIAKALSAKVKRVSDIHNTDLSSLDLLVVGSPIVGWRPTKKITDMLKAVTKLEHVHAAAFDTRLNFFIHGDAANRIVSALKKKGATIVAQPQGFFVKGKEGPLFAGEASKAKAWAKEIKKTLHVQ